MQLRRVPLSIEFAEEPFAMHMGYHIDSFIALWEELYNQVWYYGSDLGSTLLDITSWSDLGRFWLTALIFTDSVQIVSSACLIAP
jgi:hypothetical protein